MIPSVPVHAALVSRIDGSHAVVRPDAPRVADRGASTGLVVLDSAVFFLGVALLGSLLVWWARRIFVEDG